jgi:heme A synthase
MKFKITKQLKFWMQVNSAIGMAAALHLIYLGTYVTIAWVGLAINTYGLINWIFIKADDENEENNNQPS